MALFRCGESSGGGEQRIKVLTNLHDTLSATSGRVELGWEPTQIVAISPNYLANSGTMTAWYDKNQSTSTSFHILNGTYGSDPVNAHPNSTFLVDATGFSLVYYMHFYNSSNTKSILIAVGEE